MKKNNKLNFIIIALLTAVVLYFTLKDNFNQKINYLLSFNPWWLILAFLMILTYWFLKGLVLYFCVNRLDKKYTVKEGFHLMITTQFFHIITPFAAGGQPWQIYKLKKEGLSLGQSTNVVIQDFIVYQIALVLIGIVSILSNQIMHIFPSDSFLKYLVMVGFAFNFIVIIVLFIVAFSTKGNKLIIDGCLKLLLKLKILKDKEKILKKSEEFINNFHESAIVLMKSKFNFIRIILLNFIALIILYLIPFVLIKGLNLYLNPYITIVTSAYVMMIGSMVPIPGGTGGLEYSFLAFFGYFIKEPKLSCIMIVWRIVTYYFGVVVGALDLNFYKGGKK